jgi:hypothetical protein
MCEEWLGEASVLALSFCRSRQTGLALETCLRLFRSAREDVDGCKQWVKGVVRATSLALAYRSGGRPTTASPSPTMDFAALHRAFLYVRDEFDFTQNGFGCTRVPSGRSKSKSWFKKERNLTMPKCGGECFRIMTKWESYTVDSPAILVSQTLGPPLAPVCPPLLTDQEAADEVAKWYKAHKDSVEETSCSGDCASGQICQCIPYVPPQSGRPLAPSTEKVCFPVTKPNGQGYCTYLVCFSVYVQETVFPIGFCRCRNASPQPKIPIPPVGKTPGTPVKAQTLPPDTAHVTGESQTVKPKNKK